MAMGLKPLGDRIVVKPLGREEVTKSGIVLPDTAKEKPQEGTVIAVGPGRVLDSGQRVSTWSSRKAIGSSSPSTPAPSSSGTTMSF